MSISTYNHIILDGIIWLIWINIILADRKYSEQNKSKKMNPTRDWRVTIVAIFTIILALSNAIASEDDTGVTNEVPTDVGPLPTEQIKVEQNPGAKTGEISDQVITPLQDMENVETSLNAIDESETETEITSTDSIDAEAKPETQLPLELLGSSVEPGEAALLKWAVEESFVDTSAPVPILVVNGVNPGPTLCVTAAVHGDELNGIEVVRRVVHELEPDTLSGAVIGVPIVNLQGFRRASRYLPDRRDLNRFFPGRARGSYASRIAHSFFTNIIQHCDYLIDVHTGSLRRTNLPQIRANLLDPEVALLAEKMGSIVVLQSKGAKGTLRRAAVEAGIPAVTLEAGAPNNLQKDAVEQGVKSVLSALSSLELSPKSFWKRSQEPVFYQSTWIRARQGGILFSKVELGDSVKKDSVLGLLSDPITNKTTEIVAPIEGRVIGMALNQVMYPGFAAYHIGLKSSAVEAAKPAILIPEETSDDISAVETPATEEADPADPDKIVIEPETDPSEADKSPIEEMELPTMDNE